jgi:hypothetical protein
VTVEDDETTDDELEEEEIDEADLDEEEFDDEDIAEGDDDDELADEEEEEEEEAEAAVPARRKVSEEEEDDEEEADPDDVEADLDTILKDRIASGDDLDEEEEEEEVPDRNDPDAAEGVAAKKEGEFTCDLCFMIVHPRQFGRRDHLVCPEGYDDCPSIRRVAKVLK